MSSTSKLLRVSSDLARKGHELCREWLSNVDRHISENINKLTCNDIKEIYFSLHGELKRWRSSSTSFQGFSELLVYRSLYHTIGEIFNAVETGDIATDPIIFKSENYEIGQHVKRKLDGKRRFPDIYVKHNGKLISIIQIKIVTNKGKKEITQEIETFNLFKKSYPNIRGFFIVLIKESFTKDKEQRLRNAGYRTVILEDNKTPISSILSQAI
jgi:hypothetical protein